MQAPKPPPDINNYTTRRPQNFQKGSKCGPSQLSKLVSHSQLAYCLHTFYFGMRPKLIQRHDKIIFQRSTLNVIFHIQSNNRANKGSECVLFVKI